MQVLAGAHSGVDSGSGFGFGAAGADAIIYYNSYIAVTNTDNACRRLPWCVITTTIAAFATNITLKNYYYYCYYYCC